MTNVRTSLYAQGLEGSTHKFRPRWLQTHHQNPNRTYAVSAHCTCLRIEIIPENGISTAFIAGVCDRRHTPSSNSHGTSRYTLHEADYDGWLSGSRCTEEWRIRGLVAYEGALARPPPGKHMQGHDVPIAEM